jgi:hypothetical protein
MIALTRRALVSAGAAAVLSRPGKGRKPKATLLPRKIPFTVGG